MLLWFEIVFDLYEYIDHKLLLIHCTCWYSSTHFDKVHSRVPIAHDSYEYLMVVLSKVLPRVRP